MQREEKYHTPVQPRMGIKGEKCEFKEEKKRKKKKEKKKGELPTQKFGTTQAVNG